MQDDFTKLDLVRFLYQELSAKELLDLAKELDRDEQLAQAFDELELAHQQLPKVQFTPSTQTIRSILQYSDQRTLV